MEVLLHWTHLRKWNIGLLTMMGAALLAVSVACSSATPTPIRLPTSTSAPTQEPTVMAMQTEGPTATSMPMQETTPTAMPTEGPTATSMPMQETTPTVMPTEGPTATNMPMQETTPTPMSTQEPAGGGGQSTGDLMTADVGTLGTILTDGSGRTLYLYMNDEPNKSNCTDGCASIWMPFTVNGAPKVGDGVSAELVGTTTRQDGSTQVTYNGHPLYTYSGDQQAGDTNGQDVGGVWFAIDATGNGAGAPSGSSY